MSPIKTSILAALVSTAVTAGAYNHFQMKKAHEVEWLRDQNTELLYQAYAKHRNQTPPPNDAIANSKSTTSGVAASAQPAARNPTENYRNEGQATPAAALQTLAWACDRGETEVLAKLILIDPAARSKAEGFLSHLSHAEEARWKSVDEFASTQLAFSGMVSPFPNADVLEIARFESISADRTQYRLPGTRRDRMEFQKVGNDWKVVVTEPMVDLFIKTAAELETAEAAKR